MKCLLIILPIISACTGYSNVREEIVESLNTQGCKVSEYRDQADKFEYITIKFK